MLQKLLDLGFWGVGMLGAQEQTSGVVLRGSGSPQFPTALISPNPEP